MTDFMENKILSDDYSFFNKIMYGGLGHGVITIPTHFLRVITTMIFPPFGEILSIISDHVLSDFPYITWDAIKELLSYENLNRIIYSFVLTSLLYIPGLLYTLSRLKPNRPGTANTIHGVVECDPDTKVCVNLPSQQKAK